MYNSGMDILYCGDQGISRGVLVSILSLIMNGRKKFDALTGVMAKADTPVPEYHIYIMTIKYEGVKPFEAKTAEFLDALVKGKNAKKLGLGDEFAGRTNPKSLVKLIDATDVFVANLPGKNMGSYFTPCSMLRLYADKVPELAGLDRLLYLDYDVVARGDVREFYDTSLDNIEAAGVLDIYGRRWYHYRGLLKWKKDNGVIDLRPDDERYEWILKSDYMNSGVMLFNMPECLKTGMLERAVKICGEKKMLLADQAALNLAISHRKIMPRKYNEQGERPRPDTVLHHFSNNFKFWPYFKVQKVKPFEVEKIHEILKIREYDDILGIFERLQGEMR